MIARVTVIAARRTTVPLPETWPLGIGNQEEITSLAPRDLKEL